jgi:predicted RNA binding protein YcfA (HicA-like mRNA interferase family)
VGGFVIHHVSGSHYILKHPEKPKLRITLAYHNHDLKRRTLDSVLEQAGLSQEEFIDLL